MKTKFINDNHFTIYLINEYIKYKKYNKNNIENNIKDILEHMTNIYNIELNGYYKIICYHDDTYGLILDCIKDEFEYYNIYLNHIDIDYEEVNDKFIFTIKDIFKGSNIYEYKGKIYSVKSIYDYSEVIYGKKAKEIRQNWCKLS